MKARPGAEVVATSEIWSRRTERELPEIWRLARTRCEVRFGARFGCGSGLSGQMSAESATRRAVRQLLGRRWHTLVSCTLTTEYRPVRPLVDGVGGVLVALRNGTLTIGNIFQ